MSNEGKQLAVLAKNSGLGITGRLFFIAARFGIVLLITRTIGLEQYGIFVLSMTIITFAEAFALMGLPHAMVKFVAEYKAQKNISLTRGVIGFGLKASLLASLILVIGIFSLAELLADMVFHKISLAPVLRVMILALPFVSLMIILLSALQGVKLVKYRILIQQVLMPIFRIIAVAIAFWFGYQLMAVAWTWVVTAIFGFIMAVVFLSKKMGYLFSFREPVKTEKKKIITFSLPLLFNQLFYQNINIFGILIIGAFLPASQAGIYGVALRAVPFILIPLISYNAIFSPIITDLFTNRKMRELENIFKTGSRWVIVLTLPLFTLMVFFSREIASFFGPGFSESAEIIVILLIGQMVTVGTGSTALMLAMTGRPLYNLFNSGLLCFLNIGLALFFISHYGVTGVAWAYTISIVLIQLLQVTEVWYLYKIHPYSSEHLKPVLSCVGSFLIILCIESFVPIANPLVSNIILITFFLFSYGIFLTLAGFSSDERMILEKIRYKVSKKSINENI